MNKNYKNQEPKKINKKLLEAFNEFMLDTDQEYINNFGYEDLSFNPDTDFFHVCDYDVDLF